MNKESLTIDLEVLITKKLTFQEYFLLWGLALNKQVPVEEYASNCDKFSNTLLKDLRSKGYIAFSDKEKISFKDLKITDKTKELFGLSSSINFENAFEEFRSLYPSKVPDGRGSIRRLHQDLPRCKRLYQEIIGEKNIDLKKHELMKNCVTLYHKEHMRGGRTAYMQMLATWLHQKTYEQYLEETNKNIPVIENSKSNETSI